MFRIYQKEIVIFIVGEDVIQFFESNIDWFEYLKSFASNVLMRQSCTGELFYYKWLGFYHTSLISSFVWSFCKEKNI